MENIKMRLIYDYDGGGTSANKVVKSVNKMETQSQADVENISMKHGEERRKRKAC